VCGPIKAKNLIQLYLHAHTFAKRDSTGCRNSLLSFFDTVDACKSSEIRAIAVAAVIEQLVLSPADKLSKRMQLAS
jgi:hypothetical protein